MTEGFDIDHVAHLARLTLTEHERATLGPQLLEILDYTNHLQELDTEGIDPTFQVMQRANVLRADLESPSMAVDEALQNAPSREGNYFRVPRILA
ncbi:MAG: Asp-tRNA(Asn)/Glu-tRNA(Gln) amidotransferase subunit GatC [Armatimonadetes bacterium]|nr:Asp-tRNA(Asn)/Glu-tRNA(Gln) amidotransferase subunit GatC [Armatimonadota bacterium]